MGCLSDFSGNNGYYDYGKAGEDLPRRKILKTFKIPNNYYFVTMDKIPNFDYAYLIYQNEDNNMDRLFMIIDTKTLKPKYETPILFLHKITYPTKDEISISFPSYSHTPGFNIILKLTSDKITEISKEVNLKMYEEVKKENEEKKKEIEEIGKELKKFDNGNTLYLLNSEFKSITDKYLTLQDENGNELQKIELPGDNMSYYFESSSDKYCVITVYNKTTKTNSVEIYTLPDLNKVSSFPCNNKEIGAFIHTEFIDDNKIILSIGGEINICDIKSGKIEKSFMIQKNSSCRNHYKFSNDIYMSKINSYIICKWKIDGTIISKTRGEFLRTGKGFNEITKLIDEKSVICLYEKNVNIESLDQTQ